MSTWPFQGQATARTASRCTPETERGSHAFQIAGYSLHRGLGRGKFVRSAAFAVGGLDWCIRFYPDGESEEDFGDNVSFFVELLSKDGGGGGGGMFNVRALYVLSMLDPAATGLPSTVLTKARLPMEFDGSNAARDMSLKRSVLEKTPYLEHDRLLIACDITVIKPVAVSTAMAAIAGEIEVPPSDLLSNLRSLLDAKEEADVTFKVEGEIFHAHKIVLAMRSPVFKAELYGPMKEKTMHAITVHDMQPRVFGGLLHFIYTDSLPAMDDGDGDELDDDADSKEMAKHLLVAADRYAMERMKLMCESIICKGLQVESVAATLDFADQHHCSKLRNACIQFMNSVDLTADMVASQGYQHLKRECPSLFVDMWERAAMSREN